MCVKVSVYKKPVTKDIKSKEAQEQKMFVEMAQMLPSWNVLPSRKAITLKHKERMLDCDPVRNPYHKVLSDYAFAVSGHRFPDCIIKDPENAGMLDEFLMNGKISNRRVHRSYGFRSGFCAKCGKFSTRICDDHIFAVSTCGDRYREHGRQGLCEECNRDIKGNKIMIDDVARYITYKHM